MTDITSSELDFFLKGDDKLPIYLRLREAFLAMAPGCRIQVHKTCISFRAPRPFVYVSLPFRKNLKGWPPAHLVLSFSSGEPLEHNQVFDSVLIRPGLYTVHAIVTADRLLEGGLQDLVRAALLIKIK